jgi:hypothetical protein
MVAAASAARRPRLSVVAVLGPKLTEDNAAELLAAARFASRRDVERLLAQRFGAKRRRDRIEPLIGDGPGPQLPLEPAELSPGTVRDPSNCPDAPTAAPTASYEIRFTADQALVDKLEAAKDLLRHQIPDGNLAEVFARALTTFIAAATKRKAAVTDRPRKPAEPAPEAPASDDLPAEVRRQVWERDGAQCAFVGPDGHRCTERGCLEFHHVIPKAAGGPATVSNISMRCRAHNYYEAVRDFGRDKVDRARREGRPRAAAASGPPTTRVELVESALRNLEFSAAEARRAVAQARTLVPETDSTDKAALEALLRASLRVLAPPRRTV